MHAHKSCLRALVEDKGWSAALAAPGQRVRGHALRQALGATLFATYTVILFRVWPDSKTWPDAHNFYRRQWVEGMLWCAPKAL